MKNYVSSGQTMDVVAPANVASGSLVVVGQMFGVALTSAASGASLAIQTGGVYSGLPAINAAGTSATAGTNAHWDAANNQVTVSATSNLKVGVFALPKANTDTSVTVRLNESF